MELEFLSKRFIDTTVVIEMLRREFNEDTTYAAPSIAQLGLMNGLITEALAEKENRIPVLRDITGLGAITSTKQLTRHTVHTLIEYLYDKESKGITDEGRNLIGEVEAAL